MPYRYNAATRSQIERIVIENAYPKGSTFHPLDPIELMFVLRYGDLNEVSIIQDVELAFGIQIQDQVLHRLIEDKTTFIDFIRWVETEAPRAPVPEVATGRRDLGKQILHTIFAFGFYTALNLDGPTVFRDHGLNPEPWQTPSLIACLIGMVLTIPASLIVALAAQVLATVLAVALSLGLDREGVPQWALGVLPGLIGCAFAFVAAAWLGRRLLSPQKRS